MKKFFKKTLQNLFFSKNYNSDYGFSCSLKKQGLYFDNLIDIGAYDGTFTKQFTDIFENSNAILFEAQKQKIQKLKSFYNN